jgi:hypothetical protein
MLLMRAASRESRPGGHSSRLRVLVVDDDKDARSPTRSGSTITWRNLPIRCVR